MDTDTHIFVRNFAKVYPDKSKIIQYKKGYLKLRPGVKQRDLWLDPTQYDDYVERKKQKRLLKMEIGSEAPFSTPVFEQQFLDIQFAPYYKQLEARSEPFDIVSSELDRVLDQIAANESLNRSRRRSRVNIVDIIMCNEFDMFVTFSFKDDRYDIDLCKKRLMEWIKNQQKIHNKKGYKKFSYIMVPEYHADKKAIHFHALLNNYRGKITQSKNPKTGKPVIQKGKMVFNIDSYTLGFTNMTYIVHKGKTANYVSKYITKDMMNLKGKKRYWYSRDLKKPKVVYNQSYECKDLLQLHENEHFTISLLKDT